MARLLGPDANSRLVYTITGRALHTAAGLTATVYSAATGSTLADIATYDGTTTPGASISGSLLTVDGDSLLPLFWFPNGIDTVYVSVNGGTRVAVNADYDARLDAALPLAGGALTGSLTLTGTSSNLTVGGTLDVTGRMRYAGFRFPIVQPVSRRPAWRAASYSQQFQSGHGYTASGAVASSNLNDTTNFIRGTQSAQITTNGAGTQANLRKTSIGTTLDLTGKMLRLTLRVADVTHLNHMTFYAGSSSFSNFYNWTFHTHSGSNPNLIQSGEWVIVHLQWADVSSASGSYSISAGLPSATTGFTDFQLAVFDDGAAGVTVNLQSIEVVPDTTTTFPGGVISVTFDDSYVSQYTLARPKMDALGYAGTVYTIAEAVGSDHSVYMNVSDLRSLQNLSGWEVAGHAYATANHAMTNGFADLTSDQVNEDFTKLKLWLTSNGLGSENFAYPKGHFDVTTDGVPVDQIAAQYWATSRSIISETKEAFPPAMPQRILAKTGISSTATTVASLTASGGSLDRCVGSGDWLILCLHKIVTGTAADSTEISQTDFNTLMDAINSRGIPVLPVNDVIRYYT